MYYKKNLDVVVTALTLTINPRMRQVFLRFGKEDDMTPESPDILPNFHCVYDESAGEFIVMEVEFTQGGEMIASVVGWWHEEELTELCEALQHECDLVREVAKEY